MDEKSQNRIQRRDLSKRDIPPSLIEENTEKYSMKPDEDTAPQESFIVFRVNNIWFALKTKYFFESFEVKYIHMVPHRTNDFFLGLVNIHGELVMALNLSSLISTDANNQDTNSEGIKRMLQIGNGEIRFVITADDVMGNIHIEKDKFETLPESIASVKDSFLKQRFTYRGNSILIIDDNEFFRLIDTKLNW